jgi:hypothetical protein
VEGPLKAIPMGKNDDYFQWNSEFSEAPEASPAERLGIADLCDSEIRIRIGKMIALAMQQPNKKREP